MPVESDLKLDVSKLAPNAISEQTHDFNQSMMEVMEAGPNWWEVGAEKYRQMRWNGETPMPRPQTVASARNITIPSRESGREIPCRVFKPGRGDARAVFLHIHGGGWVLQSEAYQDVMLSYLADHARVAVVSVGYRLAPEKPYPAGNEDCVDVAEHLIDRAEGEYGAPLAFMGGESAGAHLSVVTCFALLRRRPRFAFKGLMLSFGAYDLSGFLPQVYHFKLPLVLTREIMQHFIFHHIEAYLPGKTLEQRRDPMISPFFADMTSMKLPPAIFTCGTLDCLLDDSVMMATKWMMSGAESILKLYPGGPHGFTFFPIEGVEVTKQALDNVVAFLNEKA